MREVKFRALSTNNKDWVYGFPLLYGWAGENWIVNWIGEKKNIKPETVGQYTGLKDKNSAEVFGGDILKHPFGVLAEVKYVRERGAFIVHFTLGGIAERNYMDGELISKCGVIGNVHQNPELLEVTN